MYRKNGPTTLSAFVKTYGLFHPCSIETLRQYQISVDLFSRWAGGQIPLDQLDAASVSEWIRDYASSGVAPSTVRSKRSHILIMWRAAADEGLCELPTRRVRPVRVPWIAPTAWTLEEVQRLVDACSRLKRWHKCGIRRSEWWALAIRVAWDTGLRWEDQVRRLRFDQITPDGIIAMPQHKTSRVVVCRLSEVTLEAIRLSMAQDPRRLVTPWAASHETFSKQLKRLVRLAGIRPGTWKWIRRASATDVEIQSPRGASGHLGHTPGSMIAERSYIDPAIVGANRPQVSPRSLAMRDCQSVQTDSGSCGLVGLARPRP
jgi:integrase